jgi:hypothetical protein
MRSDGAPSGSYMMSIRAVALNGSVRMNSISSANSVAPSAGLPRVGIVEVVVVVLALRLREVTIFEPGTTGAFSLIVNGSGVEREVSLVLQPLLDSLGDIAVKRLQPCNIDELVERLV